MALPVMAPIQTDGRILPELKLDADFVESPPPGEFEGLGATNAARAMILGAGGIGRFGSLSPIGSGPLP